MKWMRLALLSWPRCCPQEPSRAFPGPHWLRILSAFWGRQPSPPPACPNVLPRDWHPATRAGERTEPAARGPPAAGRQLAGQPRVPEAREREPRLHVGKLRCAWPWRRARRRAVRGGGRPAGCGRPREPPRAAGAGAGTSWPARRSRGLGSRRASAASPPAGRVEAAGYCLTSPPTFQFV